MVETGLRIHGALSFFMQQALKQAFDVDIALAAGAGGEIEFEIAVGGGGLADVIDCGFAERSSAQVGVQDYSGGIDERAKGIFRTIDELLFDGIGQTGESEGER